MRWGKILSEVRLSKIAHHDGIIGLHGAHEVTNANGHYVVMLLELGTGDLVDLLTRKRVLAEAEALRYTSERSWVQSSSSTRRGSPTAT